MITRREEERVSYLKTTIQLQEKIAGAGIIHSIACIQNVNIRNRYELAKFLINIRGITNLIRNIIVCYIRKRYK
jgi:hypothetical protein